MSKQVNSLKFLFSGTGLAGPCRFPFSCRWPNKLAAESAY
jgi:hypothetical protein